MKKAMAWFLMVMMCLGMTAAYGETLPCAARSLDQKALKRYPSYTEQENGCWTVRSNGADALLERFWKEGSAYTQPFLIFTVEAEGYGKTDVWQPVLRVYYAYTNKPLNARAISVAVDQMRYDLAASSGIVEHGKKKVEMISAPLTGNAAEMLLALQAGENISVRLFGDGLYTTTLDEESTVGRKRLEAASLEALDSSMALLKQAGLDDYGLWDRSAAAWEAMYGFAPKYQKNELKMKIGEYEVADAFGMVKTEDRSDAAQAMGQALAEAGFLSGNPGKAFDDTASAAVRRAQQYLGLVETGCADALLMEKLQAEEENTAPERPEYAILDGKAGISLGRYWFAKGVSAPMGLGDARIAGNLDHLLLAADGWIRNLSQEELRLFMDLKARVIYEDGYAFDATVVCEKDERSGLDISLLPMAQAHLLIYAQIPAHLALEENASWRIEISAGEACIKFDLE